MLDKQGLRLSSEFGSTEQAGTFQENKVTPIHGWFPYTEGYSSRLIKSIIDGSEHKLDLILDPFGGSATTGVETIFSGSCYHGYDINPAMKIVADAKTVSGAYLNRALTTGKITPRRFNDLVEKIAESRARSPILNQVFFDKPYFSASNLRQIDNIRQNIDAYVDDVHLHNVFLGALLSILVNVSNLKRSPDLKYRDEKDWARPSAVGEFRKKCRQILSDLLSFRPAANPGRANNYVGTDLPPELGQRNLESHRVFFSV